VALVAGVTDATFVANPAALEDPMPFEFITVERDDCISRITLDRPDKLNSFHRPMARELTRALEEAAADETVRAVYLTGAGRGFCAGQDLAEAIEAEDGPAVELSAIVEASYNPVIRAIRALDKPVVCGVNGVAAGAGANLALACDVVIAAESASFIQSFARIGLVPDTGGSWFLPRLVGLARAKALMLLAGKIPAARAVEMGMIWQSVPDQELEEIALGLARQLATQPTRGLGLTKRLLHASMTNGLDEQLDLEARLQGEAGRTQDYREGVKAFIEKRRPEFHGR